MALPSTGADQRRPSAVLRELSLEYEHDELASATLNWHASRRVSGGSYAAVYRGELKDGSEVAIKVIDLALLGRRGQHVEVAAFQEEVQLLSMLRHPNLVTLLGWSKQELQRFLVYEFLEGGNVFQRLVRSKQVGTNQPFHWHERLSVCIDAANGLSRMHSLNPKVFHRGVKSSNILLDRHGTAKMADFGLSCTSGHASIGVAAASVSPGYSCPVYVRTGQFSEGSEVYSFGIVMLELLTGLAPTMADPERPGVFVCTLANTLAPHSPGALSRCTLNVDASAGWPPPLASELATLALRCLDTQDEAQRPRMSEVLRALRSLAERAQQQQQHAEEQPPSTSAAAPVLGARGPASGPSRLASSLLALAEQALVAADGRSEKLASCVAPAALGSPNGDAVPAAGAARALVEVAFCLEFVRATCTQADAVPPQHRRLPLVFGSAAPGAAEGLPIGRVHQADLFEAWVPDAQLRNCVSRTAFELSRSSDSSGGLTLTVRGTNPVSVDRQLVAQGVEISVRPGSEIAFYYNQTGQQEPFLILRLQQAKVPTTAAPNGVSAGQAQRAPTVPVPRTPVPAAAAVPCRWHLACIHAEGLPQEQLASLATRQLELPAGTLFMGRERQPHFFEVLLAGAPQLLTFISRVHVELVVSPESDSLLATNISANPVYLDHEPLAKGQTRKLTQDQVISFARPEGPEGSVRHVHFLVLQVQAVDGAMLVAAKEKEALASATAGRAPEMARQPSLASEKRLEPAPVVRALPVPGPGSPLLPQPAAVVAAQEAPAQEAPAQAEVAAAVEAAGAVRNAGPPPTQLPCTALGSDALKRQPTQPCSPETSRTPVAALAPELTTRARRGDDLERPSVPQPMQEPLPEAANVASIILPAPAPHAGGCTPPYEEQQQANHLLEQCGGAESPSPQDQYRQPRSVSPREEHEEASSCSPQHGAQCVTTPQPQPQQQAALPSHEQEPQRRSPEFGNSPATPESPATQVTSAPPQDRPLSAEVMLELHGESTLDVPVEQRRIGPVSLAVPLLVGRRHQPDVHRRAVKKECLQFLSRDHFSISYESRELWMHTLTPNPIWIFRRGEDVRELASGDVAQLSPGDSIALGTGGEDHFISAEEARRRLTWRVRAAAPGGPLEPPEGVWEPEEDPTRGSPHAPSRSLLEAEGGSSPSSPGGRGPRVSLAPWAPQRPAPTLGSLEPASSFASPLPAPAVAGGVARQWTAQAAPTHLAPAQAPRMERPSELCSPVPRLLGSCGAEAAPKRGWDPPPHTAEAPPARGVDTSASLPRFGGGGAWHTLEGALEEIDGPSPHHRQHERLNSLEVSQGADDGMRPRAERRELYWGDTFGSRR